MAMESGAFVLQYMLRRLGIEDMLAPAAFIVGDDSTSFRLLAWSLYRSREKRPIPRHRCAIVLLVFRRS